MVERVKGHNEMSHWFRLLILLIFPCFCFGGSIGALSGQEKGPEKTAQQPAVSPDLNAPEDYRLQIGDVIEVKFFYDKDLNDKVEIGPDGKISLQLVHEIKAAGLTRAQLRELIIDRYARVLKSPEVAVIVRTFAGQRIFVGGEVHAPGLQPLETETNLLQAILRAGGPKNTARSSNIILLRKGKDNKPAFSIVNLEKTFASGDTQTGPILQPYDVVFVPKSRIAKANQFVDQYMKQLLPITLVGGFNFLVGNFKPF